MTGVHRYPETKSTFNFFFGSIRATRSWKHHHLVLMGAQKAQHSNTFLPVTHTRTRATRLQIRQAGLNARVRVNAMPFTGKGVKHAGSRVHYFKEAIWDGEVVLVWRPTDDLLADLLTKPLMGDKFDMHDERARKGVLWNDRPALPKQPNSVFEKGLKAGVLAVRELNDRMNVEGLGPSGSDGVLD